MRCTSVNSRGVVVLVAIAIVAMGGTCFQTIEDRHCVMNAAPRVSETRTAQFFGINYIYFGSNGNDDDTRYLGIAKTRVAAAWEVANAIYRRNGINISFLALGCEGRRSTVLYNVRSVGIRAPDPDAQAEMARIHGAANAEAGVTNIGIHWARYWRGTTDTGNAWGGFPCTDPLQCNFVLMVSTFENSMTDEQIGEMLAHELGHYFNLPHVDDSRNLMYGGNASGGSGTSLTQDQRDVVWREINGTVQGSSRDRLMVLTCDGLATTADSTRKSSRRGDRTK